jgi:hypothetical protein
MDAWNQDAAAPAPVRRPSPARHACSPLVNRLIQPDIDPGRFRIRHLLVQMPNERLRTGLGLSDEDIALLRLACLLGNSRRAGAARAAATGASATRAAPAAARPAHEVQAPDWA